MNRYALFFSFLLYTAALPGLSAAAPPIPPSKKERVENLSEKLQERTGNLKLLKKKTRNIESELQSTKSRLVQLGQSIQKNENALESLESRIAELNSKKEVLNEDLQDDRQSIARLILALERLRRMPPEAMIARPDTPLKTAQSAMLMRDIIPVLHRQAETLKNKLSELEEVSKDLERKREIARETSQTLKKEHAKLSGLVGKKEELYASTSLNLQEQKESVERISLQARNLQDLVSKLENDRARESARAQTRNAVLTMPEISMPRGGQSQLPISGIIRTRFDERDSFGSLSKGVSIEGRGGALVVAPMGGVVRFAGHFKNYGNLVILEHNKGYHSLIAGLEKIDTVVGHSVSAGEPLGFLHHGITGEKPALYFELRHNGRPVNPATKFADLG